MSNYVRTSAYIGEPHYSVQLGNNLTASTCDATGEKTAFIGSVWNKDGTTKNITKIGFRFYNVTKAGGSGLTVSLQNVDTANGPPYRPDGVQDQTVAIANGDAAFAPNTWYKTAALSAVRTVTFGELLAIVWEFDGGGRLGADGFQISGAGASGISGAGGLPGSVLYTGTWGADNFIPIVVLEFDDGTFGTLRGAFICKNEQGVLQPTSATTPDEVALQFSLPYNCKIDGAWIMAHPSAGNADFDIILYEGTTAKVTFSLDGNIHGGGVYRAQAIAFPEVEITANTTYYLAVKPTTANAVNANYYDVNEANFFQAVSGGTSFIYASRVDGGAWTSVTTRRLIAGVFISAIDIRSPSELVNSTGVIG